MKYSDLILGFSPFSVFCSVRLFGSFGFSTAADIQEYH
jgi:hypothetical protein